METEFMFFPSTEIWTEMCKSIKYHNNDHFEVKIFNVETTISPRLSLFLSFSHLVLLDDVDDGSPPGNGVTIKGIHHALRTEKEKQSFKMCVSNTHTIKCRSRSESSSIWIRIKMIQGVRKITKDKFYFIKISYKSFANLMANLDKFKNIKIF